MLDGTHAIAAARGNGKSFALRGAQSPARHGTSPSDWWTREDACAPCRGVCRLASSRNPNAQNEFNPHARAEDVDL